MAEAEMDYDFEQFPRGEIQFVYPRRRFLSALMTEVRVFNKMADGHVGRKLSDLGCWPDEALWCVVPVVMEGCRIEEQGGSLTGAAGDASPVVLFSLDSPAYQVYRQFDGVNTLTEIADSLSHQTGWAEEKAFAYTRGVFLSMVLLGLARPRYS